MTQQPNLRKNPRTGKWEVAKGLFPSRIVDAIGKSNKFRTQEEVDAITEQRIRKKIPVKTTAQELDISSWWSVNKISKKVTFNKDNYEIQKNADGTTTIKSKPVTYLKSYRKSGKRKSKEQSTYVPHENDYSNRHRNISVQRIRRRI